jgi:hypothetical protein
MTLSMAGSSMPENQKRENAGQLSPCHNQNSLPNAAFCGNAYPLDRRAVRAGLWMGVLCS